MSLWLRVLFRFAPNWHHRVTCPDTVEAIAQDFIDNHLPPLDEIRTLGLDFDNTQAYDPWFAWRRRISSIYGVSTCYASPNGRLANQGWNRQLWRNNPGADPDQLTDRIFENVIRRLRGTSGDTT